MKIGFISMPLAGHLNPMIALARKLQSRGHEIVFIGVPDAGPTVRAAGLNFISYCEEEFPAGACASALAPVAKIHGMEATRWTIEGAGRAFFRAASQHLPRVLAEAGVEALVLDTIHMYLEVVPMSLGIPYAHVWAILNIDFSGTTLPSVVSGRYEDTPEARARNIEELKKSDNAFFGLVQPLAEEYAEQDGLKLDWSNHRALLGYIPLTMATMVAGVLDSYDCRRAQRFFMEEQLAGLNAWIGVKPTMYGAVE